MANVEKAAEATCRWCGVRIWRISLEDGKGVLWKAERTPTRGIYTVRCHQKADSPEHQPDLPDMTDPVEVEAWLAGVREGLDP